MFLAMRRRAVERDGLDLSRYAPLLNYEKRGHSSRFTWYPPKGARTVFFPGCALPGTRPGITWRFFEELRRSKPDLQMVLDCCHKPSHDLGRQAYFLERFGSIRDRLVEMGVEEVIVACPNCWRVFHEYGAPLEVTTAYQVLAEAGQEKIRHCPRGSAVPCASDHP
jgi:Fe-S oxidoreductase